MKYVAPHQKRICEMRLVEACEEYHHAVSECLKLRITLKHAGTEAEYYHTPLQINAILKLQEAQQQHRSAVRQYAEGVGEVDRAFLPEKRLNGDLLPPRIGKPGNTHLDARKTFGCVALASAIVYSLYQASLHFL